MRPAVKRRKFGGRGTGHVFWAGRRWALAKVGDGETEKYAYRSGQRIAQGLPSDEWEMVYEDFSPGIGVAYHYTELLAVKKGLLGLPPATASVSYSSNLGADPAREPRDSIELQDADGRWYKYFFGPKDVIKVDLGVNPPVVRQVKGPRHGTAGFDANDFLGQPAVMIRAGAKYLYIPVDNGDAWVEMTLPVAQDNGTLAVADTFTRVTSVTGGAAHLVQQPDGSMVRAVSFFAAAVAQNRAAVSVLPPGLNPDTDANWGEGFPVDDQTKFITQLMMLDDLLLIGKENGWFAFTTLSDGRLKARNVMPDFPFLTDFGNWFPYSPAPTGLEISRGAVWSGAAWLPSPSRLIRHLISSYLPVDPDAVRGNPTWGDIAENAGGFVRAVAPFGEWLYLTYTGHINGGSLLAARRRAGEPGELEVLFHNILPLATGVSPTDSGSIVSPQLNGLNAPRIWVSENDSGSNTVYLHYFTVGRDGAPYTKDSAVYGVAGQTYEHLIEKVALPSFGHVREVELWGVGDPADVTWKGRYYRDLDFDTAVETAAVSGSGVGYFGSSEAGSRNFVLALEVTTGAGYTPISPSWEIARVAFRGLYEPQMGEQVQFMIDLAKTAAEESTTVDDLLEEIEAAMRVKKTDWIDVRGKAGVLQAMDATHAAPKGWGAVEGEDDRVTITAIVARYA